MRFCYDFDRSYNFPSVLYDLFSELFLFFLEYRFPFYSLNPERRDIIRENLSSNKFFPLVRFSSLPLSSPLSFMLLFVSRASSPSPSLSSIFSFLLSLTCYCLVFFPVYFSSRREWRFSRPVTRRDEHIKDGIPCRPLSLYPSPLESQPQTTSAFVSSSFSLIKEREGKSKEGKKEGRKEEDEKQKTIKILRKWKGKKKSEKSRSFAHKSAKWKKEHKGC